MSGRRIGPDADAVTMALAEVREQGERGRPDLVLEFDPQCLREAGVDPVSVLDRFRSLGLLAEALGGDLPTDPGELVLALDAGGSPAPLRLVPVAGATGAGERLLPARRRLGRRCARSFPPVEPGTLAYDATHRALIGSLLDDPEWRALFASGRDLPAGLGAGYDERVIEYPWLFSREVRGRVLDAGSVLNHRHLLERMLPEVEELTIATLAPESLAFNSMGVSYLYADLRELPLRDDWFDEVVCLSTLEHVGMDNTFYGAGGDRATDPGQEATKALRELQRVVKPGGRIHLSVPFGRREDHGWFRQFDRADIDALFDHAGVGQWEESVFAHSRKGWRRVSAPEVADAAYNASRDRDDDLAVAARAVVSATIFV